VSDAGAGDEHYLQNLEKERKTGMNKAASVNIVAATLRPICAGVSLQSDYSRR
jgi:hypothetical protein